MEDIAAIKKKLKTWEAAFSDANGRKPGKDDVSHASTDIQDLYTTYFRLKKQSTEPSTKPINGDTSASRSSQPLSECVWGAHLNKQAKSTTSKAAVSASQDSPSGSFFMKSLGKKLLAKATQHSSQSVKVPSQRIFSNDINGDSTPSNDDSSLKSFSKSPRDCTDITVTSSVFSGGVKITQKTLDTVAAPSRCDKLTITPNRNNKKATSLKLQQKYRNFSFDKLKFDSSPPSTPVFQTQDVTEHAANTLLSFEDAKNTVSPCESSSERSSPNFAIFRSLSTEDLPFPMSQNVPRMTRSLTSTPTSAMNMSDDGTASVLNSSNDDHTPSSLSRQFNPDSSTDATSLSSEKISPDRNFKEVTAGKRQSPDTLYSQIKPDNVPKKRVAHGTKRKHDDSATSSGTMTSRSVRARFDRSMDSLNDDSDSMFIDVRWRPNSRQEEVMIDLDSASMDETAILRSCGDIVDSPISDAPQQVPDENSPPQPSPRKKKASAKKREPVASKVSNDNFVRLNMKVKRYSKKGGMNSRTGSWHKRQAWKQKMKARGGWGGGGGAGAGGGKCFKCGQEGHWAKNCKGGGKMGAVSSFNAAEASDNTVKDSDFPTLKQAFNMARGIKPSPKAENSGATASAKSTSSAKSTASSRSTASAKAAKSQKSNQTMDEGVTHFDDIVAADGLAPDSDDDDDPEVIRVAYESAPAPPAMEPLLQRGESGELPEPTPAVYQALSKFGFEDFREGQRKAIMRVLCGESTLVVLSTGAGKSLCYQLPAYLYAQRSESLVLVISPLVSLMEDQVANLPPGIKGACLHTNMTPGQREKVIESVKAGAVHFLLISPEALVSGGSRGCLSGVSSLPPISFACIDEAHCLSEWSHHFRPSYLRICKILRERFGVHCMLGLTATATMVTAASVAKHLGVVDYQTGTIRGSPVPSNLCLSVSRDEDRDEALIGLLQGERFSKCRSIIVYCTRREVTDRVATLIRTCLQEVVPDEPADDGNAAAKGKATRAKKTAKRRTTGDAQCYHAGLSACHRKRVQTAFMDGRLRIVVATVAFGMGLDKRDVRGIVHYNLPKSFESYVQEIGRAGRDGQTAHCHLFLDPRSQDMHELKRHIYSNTVDRVIIKRLVRHVFPPCRCRELEKKYSQSASQCAASVDGDVTDASTGQGCVGHERTIAIDSTVQSLDMKEEGISTLLCYLELHPNRWVENFSSVYGSCTIQCYGGPKQLQQVAKQCPPVAVAIAQQRKCGVSYAKTSKLQFRVVDVSDAMGWESGPVKKQLKLLQWEFGATGPRKTGVMVEFSDLSLHLRSRGDVSNEQLDEIVTFLHERMTTQERTELEQLQSFHNVLFKVSHKNVWMCSEAVDVTRSDRLKVAISDYFEAAPAIEHSDITMLSFARESSSQQTPLIASQSIPSAQEEDARSDVRAFIQIHGSEHQLTGRAIARVFHGIASPCFPAEVWGRARRFWRSHLDVDFNVLIKLATLELVRAK